MSDTTREITIAGHAFTISTPFTEGHVCTAAEAKALNQTRCENIRNNLTKRVKDAMDEDGNIADMDELVTAVANYDGDYIFTLANVGGGRTVMDPVEKEARKIARELIVEALKENGRKVGEVDKEKLAAAVAAKAEEDEILKLAKKRLDDRAKRAAEALEGLDLD